MSSLVISALEPLGVPCYDGYAATGAKLPYLVVRPMTTDPDDFTVCGGATTWTDRVGVYCCAASVAASANLARDVAGELVGKNLGSGVAHTSVAYYGNELEGQYESLVTVTTTEGAL